MSSTSLKNPELRTRSVAAWFSPTAEREPCRDTSPEQTGEAYQIEGEAQTNTGGAYWMQGEIEIEINIPVGL